MDKLVFATGNKDKLREVRDVLGDIFEIVSPSDVGVENFDVVEDADTLEGNALKKARELYEIVHMPVIADDSGLFVDYLGGEPGVYSARYSGSDATYDSNKAKLLDNLLNVPRDKRSAEFRTVIAYIDKDGQEKVVVGVVRGEITTDLRGDGGFGYDPVFYIEEYDMTYAQMPSELKNKISHRAVALEKFRRAVKH